MYRDDDAARGERANALIDEIAGLERRKLTQAATDHRLEAARHELRALQHTTPAVEPRAGLLMHLAVFGATAAATFLAYTVF